MLGSSINMHIGGLAPAIVSSDDGVFKTIKTSTRTYGVAWHEALVIKAVTWLSLLILGTLSFLPKFIQHYHFAGDSARWVGWISSTVLVAVFFVLTKVISGVMMTTLYHQVKTNPERFK